MRHESTQIKTYDDWRSRLVSAQRSVFAFLGTRHFGQIRGVGFIQGPETRPVYLRS